MRALLWVVDGFPYFLPGLVGFILVLATKATAGWPTGRQAHKSSLRRHRAAGIPEGP
jgi:hypothetical protein